jgi:hypothetical protein
MTAKDTRRGTPRNRTGGEHWVYNAVLAAGFLVFLAAALVECLMPWRWRGIADRWSHQSVIAEAMDAAKTTIPFAFMG